MDISTSFHKIANLIHSGYVDRGERIAKIIDRLISVKSDDFIQFDDLPSVNHDSNVMIGYSKESGSWIVAAFNRIVKACRGYAFNPNVDMYYIVDISVCRFNFRACACIIEKENPVYAVFTREDAGEVILKSIFRDYYDMGA